MKNVLLIVVLLIMSLTACTQETGTFLSKPELTVYAGPDGAPVNTTFSVFVKYEGGEWIDLHEYDAEVDAGYLKKPEEHMAFVSFDSDYSKKIDIKVVKNKGKIETVKIRPTISGVKPVVEGNTITFSITEPIKLSVEINDDLYNNLMVFANSLEIEKPNPDDPKVHYFGPGIHKLGSDGKGNLFLDDNETVYIAGGAIVYGTIKSFATQNISITGRGILGGGMYTDHAYPHPGAKGLINFIAVNNAKIEGITLLNTVSWNIHLFGSQNIECRNLKIIGWTINSDGIDPQCSSDIIIDDCFVRNFDDCVSIKMNYGLSPILFEKASKNITVQNCIFWTDQGRSILIGPESYRAKDNIYENITIKNIDILYNENFDVDWAKGALAINLGDNAIARNITFEDIRVDKLGNKTNLITLTMDKYTYNVSEAKRMENIQFNNITLNSEQNYRNYIWGFDKSKIISDVQFNNLIINGKKIKNAKQGWFDVNEHINNITFK
ncbi:MAG: glycosyl hydrolase family 28 protein [Bacteroidota bacterium]